MLCSILTLEPVPHRVGEDRFEAFALGAWHIRMLVGHEPHDLLRLPAAHHPRLPMIDLKALFESDCGNQGLEPLRATGKRCVTRKHEIVGVARVDCARRTRSSGNPRIETIRREIREGRRCRGTLGEVTVHQTPASADACGERALVPVLGKAGVRDRIENTFRDLESAQPGQNARHAFWIAESAKNTVDTCGADRRKELFQVHA